VSFSLTTGDGNDQPTDTRIRKVQVTSSLLADYRFQALQESNQDLIHTILENRDMFMEEIRSRVDILQKTTESSLLNVVARINERIPSNQEIEVAVQRSALDSLYFASSSQRYEEVAEAHRSTFEWIFKADQQHGAHWSNFPEWLQSGNGLYWLSGKAASGKSTLMRHILDSGEAYKFLRCWATGYDLDIFTFFFWNSNRTAITTGHFPFHSAPESLEIPPANRVDTATRI